MASRICHDWLKQSERPRERPAADRSQTFRVGSCSRSDLDEVPPRGRRQVQRGGRPLWRRSAIASPNSLSTSSVGRLQQLGEFAHDGGSTLKRPGIRGGSGKAAVHLPIRRLIASGALLAPYRVGSDEDS